jgi:succinate dehydrogenase / fumarate reductase cytochrome b subunit
MTRPAGSYSTSVGKKIAMAITGFVLVAYVIVHMLGNLKVYQGAEAFNHYAEGLRTLGAPFFGREQLLWIARIILLVSAVVHIGSAFALVLRSRAARPIRYRQFDSLAFSYASRTMVWGGVILLAFVVYHLLHLTFGTAHPDFIAGNAYHNFVVGFQSWPVSVAYTIAMIALGLHLYHGVWSGLQTLGADGSWYDGVRRPAAAVIALAVVLGNISFPIAVLSGIVR